MPRCTHAFDRTLWRDQPTAHPGEWIVTLCTRCGGVVGRRPPEKSKARQEANEDAGLVVNVDQEENQGLFEE